MIIEVLCNRAMLDLLAPIEHSRPVPNGYDDDYVAIYDEDTLTAVPEDRIRDAGAFWRHTPGLLIDVPFDPEGIKTLGLRGYICDTVNLSNEKHTAGAIAELARNAGMSQIEFMNWCADNIPAGAA
jgi:hypothetical protein